MAQRHAKSATKQAALENHPAAEAWSSGRWGAKAHTQTSGHATAVSFALMPLQHRQHTYLRKIRDGESIQRNGESVKRVKAWLCMRRGEVCSPGHTYPWLPLGGAVAFRRLRGVICCNHTLVAWLCICRGELCLPATLRFSCCNSYVQGMFFSSRRKEPKAARGR